MSLYDDIGLDKKDLGDARADVSGWSVGHRLLHSHSSSKKGPSSSSSASSKKKQALSLAPVVNLNSASSNYGALPQASLAAQDGEIRFNHITGKLEAGPAPRPYAQLGVKTYPAGSPFADMSEEYDPSFPNDYVDFSRRLKKLKNEEREREEQGRELERRREAEERQKRREEERKEKLEKISASFMPPTSLYNDSPKATQGTKLLALYGSSSDSDDDEKSSANKRTGNMEFAAPTPPTTDQSKQPPGPSQPASMDDEAADSGTFKIEGKGGSVASKIMARMGYKQGGGLGRDEQGMSVALQVEKTSRRGGKILHERDLTAKDFPSGGAPIKAETGITNNELLRSPSKVLLLTNMVGPGEVDDELESETAEECSKYGKVIKCVIFELKNVPDVLAVRIFIEFEKISFAIKAAIDLNGRFFGGRVVRAAFYSHDKFLNMQLADEPL